MLVRQKEKCDKSCNGYQIFITKIRIEVGKRFLTSSRGEILTYTSNRFSKAKKSNSERQSLHSCKDLHNAAAGNTTQLDIAT